jgi:hypothetical protein
MNFNSPALSYIFLIIPAFFAFTVIAQGMTKMKKHEDDGPIVFGFGIVLLILIGVAYWLYIR